MNEKGVQTLDRSFDILELLATEKSGLGVTEIAQRTGLHKSTVHRLISAMSERGYIEKNAENGMYKLGLKLVEICSLFLSDVELRTEALPYLRKLASESTQPVHLATLVDGEAVYIEKVEVLNSIRLFSQIGKRIPVHCSAIGKALLSGISDEEIEEILSSKGLSAYTPTTITDKSKLLDQIQQVRKRGWAADDQEHDEGIRCIAAPIYDYRGKVIASVSTAGSANVLTPERDEEISRYVISAAAEISKRMGYNPGMKT